MEKIEYDLSPSERRYDMKEKNTKRKSGTDWKRLERMTDEETDISDIPPLDVVFFKNATLRMPTSKKAVSLRLDTDLLDWFREQGTGYQTKINAVLRVYMQAMRSH